MNKKDEDLKVLKASEAKLFELERRMWLAYHKPEKWLAILYGLIGSWAIFFIFLVVILVSRAIK